MSFSRKKTNSNFSYVLNNEQISRPSSYKYLGVHLSPNLSWSLHITSIRAKASQTLGYLRRNLRKAPSDVRKLAYLTFVRPQLEFASPIWSPFQNYLTTMLESVQNRAARFISGTFDRHASVTKIKLDTSLPPLEKRRSIALLCLFHKYVHNSRLSPLPLVTPVRMSRRLHNQFSFSRIYGNTRAFNSSALPRAISMWNDLPDTIASITDSTRFREHVSRHFSC